MHSLHWFRTDLRIKDNTALSHAMAVSKELIAVFILTPHTWKQHHEAPIKIQFILDNLKSLSHDLWKQKIPLLIRHADSFDACPAVIESLCAKYKINAVYFNKQYEVDEQQRDEKVVSALNKKNILTHTYDDQLVFAPGSLLSKQHTPLKVFTPFKKTWLHRVAHSEDWQPVVSTPKKFSSLVAPDTLVENLPEFKNNVSFVWQAGEKAADHLRQHFCEEKISRYHIDRDFPSTEGTSQLSPYLAQGIISPRQCIHAIVEKFKLTSLAEIQHHAGPACWLDELIWREFYKHIMFYFPKVCRYQPLRAYTDKLKWNDNPAQFKAWCEGMTGFPLVDAAMRQLNQTGWMHNRLRMLVAVFFSKILFLDWRKGERYFMEHLIDGDLAANNGGWQWCASTGTDAVPYFRIFNPTTQSERYDSDGHFIRKFCPELSHLNNHAIHNPYSNTNAHETLSYPRPIVDYKKSREHVLAAFKKIS